MKGQWQINLINGIQGHSRIVIWRQKKKKKKKKTTKKKKKNQTKTTTTKLGVVGISTLWHCRLPLPIQMFIKVASSPRLSGIGMPSPILWSHLLKMQMIVLLSSLLWWELGTNSLITGPGEWLSFRRFTSKLSWSWSWSSWCQGLVAACDCGTCSPRGLYAKFWNLKVFNIVEE